MAFRSDMRGHAEADPGMSDEDLIRVRENRGGGEGRSSLVPGSLGTESSMCPAGRLGCRYFVYLTDAYSEIPPIKLFAIRNPANLREPTAGCQQSEKKKKTATAMAALAAAMAHSRA